MSDSTQTKETTQEDVDLITELFQDLISDIVDLKPYTTNVSLLQSLEMKHSSDNKPPIDTALRTLPGLSDEKVNTESNLEKIEEYPEIEFESKLKTYKNIKINANKAAVQRLENSRKNIGDVIDPEQKYSTVYSIDANSFGKTKYHTILSIAPKETSTKTLRQSENNDSKAITGNLKKNIEKKGGYQCFQVISSALIKPSEAGKNKQSEPFKAKDINTTRVVNKNEETDKNSQTSKFKMNTLNSSELSERIKYLAKRINLNRLNKRMKIEKNIVDHPKPKPKTKTPLTMPSLITSKQQHQKNTKLSQPITKKTQPKLQVSTVGRPISPNWMTKQNREKYSKNTHPKNKNNDHSTQKCDDNLKSKREVDFVAKRIVIQPASKSNFKDTCHLKLVLAEMDKRKSDSKQFINSAVAEQLRNIFKNIKDRKTSPKILVKPPKISNEYEKEKLMNSIPGILNEILQQNSSTSLIKNNLECSNQTSKKNNKLKSRFRKHDIPPIQVEVMKQIRTMNELRSSYRNEHNEREGKYINSETKLLNSIKPEDILPISAEYSKQKKLKSVSKSAASLLSIGPNDMNVLTKKAHKMRDDIDTNELDTPSPRKIHKHKVSILKFNDILKLKRLSNTLANYFRRSNRSFETIIPLTVQCLYNKGKVLTKHQYSLWKQYNAKNCVVPNKTGDNNTFVRPYTPLIEIPLKSAQKLPSSTCIRRISYCNMGRQSHSNIMQQSLFKDRFGTTNISSQESDASDDDARVRRSNSYSTRSNSTSVYSDKSLSSSHHISGKGKEETVLKVINAEMDDSTLKGDPTLGGILGLSVHNLKDNNDIHYFRPTVEKEPNDWLFRQYPTMNGRKVYTKPMMRRLYDQKNIRRSCTVEDGIDLKSTLVC